MRKLFIVLHLLGCLLWSILCSASQTPEIDIRVDKNTASIGEVVLLTVKINISDASKISWNAMDNMFLESDKVVVLDIITRNRRNLVVHQIAFTSASANSFVVKELPIQVNNKTYLTKLVTVQFKSSPIPKTIHPIKDLKPVDLSAIGIVLLYIALQSLLLFTVVKLIKRLSQAYQLKRHEEKLLEVFVMKLLEFEKSIHSGQTNHGLFHDIVDQFQRVTRSRIGLLNDCSELGNVNSRQILTDADAIRYLSPEQASPHYPGFIRQVQEFLNKFQK